MRKKRQRRNPTMDITEDQLQGQLNDLLNAYQIRYLRFPDYAWQWLKRNAPIEVLKALTNAFGGMPDNICLIPIGEKYSLALGIELKVKGRKRHGKQKHWQSVVSRTPDENISIVDQFLKDANHIKENGNE